MMTSRLIRPAHICGLVFALTYLGMAFGGVLLGREGYSSP